MIHREKERFLGRPRLLLWKPSLVPSEQMADSRQCNPYWRCWGLSTFTNRSDPINFTHPKPHHHSPSHSPTAPSTTSNTPSRVLDDTQRSGITFSFRHRNTPHSSSHSVFSPVEFLTKASSNHSHLSKCQFQKRNIANALDGLLNQQSKKGGENSRIIRRREEFCCFGAINASETS